MSIERHCENPTCPKVFRVQTVHSRKIFCCRVCFVDKKNGWTPGRGRPTLTAVERFERHQQRRVGCLTVTGRSPD